MCVLFIFRKWTAWLATFYFFSTSVLFLDNCNYHRQYLHNFQPHVKMMTFPLIVITTTTPWIYYKLHNLYITTSRISLMVIHKVTVASSYMTFIIMIRTTSSWILLLVDHMLTVVSSSITFILVIITTSSCIKWLVFHRLTVASSSITFSL